MMVGSKFCPFAQFLCEFFEYFFLIVKYLLGTPNINH